MGVPVTLESNAPTGESHEPTGEEVIREAVRLLSAHKDIGFTDIDHPEPDESLSRFLERYHSDPVAPGQLTARKGGLLANGLVTTVFASPLVIAIVAQIIADQVQAGARAARRRFIRRRARRNRERLGAALGQPAQRFRMEDAAWLRGYIAATCHGAGCVPEQAEAVADAVSTAWLASGGPGARSEPGPRPPLDPGPQVPDPAAADGADR